MSSFKSYENIQGKRMGQIILFLIINCSAQELDSIMFAEYSRNVALYV